LRNGHAGVFCLERDAPLVDVTRPTPVKIATRLIARIGRLADLLKGRALMSACRQFKMPSAESF
jgi:hypothetical protein